jgi:hypothetical protein
VCQGVGHNAKWCPKSKKHCTEEEAIAYFDFLGVAVLQDQLQHACVYALTVFASVPPTLHTDGGSAFGPLCREIARSRTSCAIHLESKVAACNSEIKKMVSRCVGVGVRIGMAFILSGARVLVYTIAWCVFFTGVHQWVAYWHGVSFEWCTSGGVHHCLMRVFHAGFCTTGISLCTWLLSFGTN